jgi:flagellar assembly protein FliH
MLSKIVSGEEAEKVQYQLFTVPSREEIAMIIEEKMRQAQRERIIEDNKDDPVKAAKSEANKILIDAQEKLKAAEVEANILKSRKEKELRLQLEKEYQAKFEQQLQNVQQNYQKTLGELANLKNTLYKNSERQLTDLVFAVTHKVIGFEIQSTPDIVLKMLKKGFEKIKEAKEYEIKVNPVDYETIEKQKDVVGEILKTTGSVRFSKDENIQRGGCHIITEQGEISSEPGRQLEIIMRELSDGA